MNGESYGIGGGEEHCDGNLPTNYLTHNTPGTKSSRRYQQAREKKNKTRYQLYRYVDCWDKLLG